MTVTNKSSAFSSVVQGQPDILDILPPSSGWNNKPSKKPTEASSKLSFLLGFFFYPEGRGLWSYEAVVK